MVPCSWSPDINGCLSATGADVIYSQLMSDFATDEKEFEADSWSLAVDNNYLQQHKKDVMKRQDVIYGEHWEFRQAYGGLCIGSFTQDSSIFFPVESCVKNV